MKSLQWATDKSDVKGEHTAPGDEGFTLIELLIVIVILGVLATVVVFAVGGISDRGQASATSADAKTIEHAEEAHMAMHGTYASEDELVAAGFMRDVSTIHDIDVPADRSNYEVGAAGSFPAPATTTTIAPGGGDGGDGGDGGATTTTIAPGGGEETTTTTTVPTVPTNYLGFSAQSTGAGSKTLVIIGRNSSGTTQVLFDQLTSTPLPDTRVIWLDQSDINDTDDVDRVVESQPPPNYIVAAEMISIANSSGGPNTYVGQYMSTLMSTTEFWWTHQHGRNPTPEELIANL